jgi:hypothetical protein
MSYKKSHKILSTAFFFIFLIILVLALARIRNISLDQDFQATIIYFLLGIATLTGLGLYIQIITLTKEKISKEEYIKKTYLTDIEGSAARKEEDEEEEQEIDQKEIESLHKKIIPKETKGKASLQKHTEQVLSNLAKEFDIVQGLYYTRKKDSDTFTIAGKFAYFGEEEPKDFDLGSTLSGQTAQNQKILNLTKIPENYITILSGLGSSSPKSILYIPVINQEKTIGLIELASFKVYGKKTEKLLASLKEKLGEQLANKI